MSRPVILLILLVAAFLESGGDALMRKALHASTALARPLFFFLAAVVLCGYSLVVNAPPWDFGRLLGVYVVCFFVSAQVIAYIAFGNAPDRTVMLGGVFVLIGGAIMSFGNPK